MEVFFNTMPNIGLVPSRQTYNIIINAFLRSGRVEKGLSYFEKMKQAMPPHELDYLEMLRIIEKFDKYDLKRKLRGELEELRASTLRGEE
jgi:pentatricopeptide repeat protein